MEKFSEIVFLSIATGALLSMIAAFAGILLQVFHDNDSITIYTDPSDEGNGWHCSTTDWFWIRGFFSVIGCYLRSIATFGRFRFAWETN